MDIGIIGAGMIGGTLARLLAERGHRLHVGTRSSDYGRADPRVAALPSGVRRASVTDAARFGVATIVAVPFVGWPELARTIGPGFDGRVVLDTSNAIPGRVGALARAALATGAGSGVAVAALVPGARIVKAFSSVHFETLAKTAGAQPPIAIPIAGNDQGAVAVAASIVAAAGFAPVPAGPLISAARFDFGTPLFNATLTELALRCALQSDF